jgi:hypothetical protein
VRRFLTSLPITTSCIMWVAMEGLMRSCVFLLENLCALGDPPPKNTVPQFVPMSVVSSVSLLPYAQVALMKLDKDRLHKRMLAHEGGATIKALFKLQPAEKPFLYNARGAGLKAYTTYGGVYDFIDGGPGDLLRLGVTPVMLWPMPRPLPVLLLRRWPSFPLVLKRPPLRWR